VKDSYAWFKDLVKQRRGMDDTQLEKVVDGRVFTGRQAIDLKLIDELGDEKKAVTWLEEQKGVKKGLSVRDYKLEPRFSDLPFLRTAASVTLEALGLGSIAHQIEKTGVVQAVDRFGMDGMLALWQPARVELTETQWNRASFGGFSRLTGGGPARFFGICHAFSRRSTFI